MENQVKQHYIWIYFATRYASIAIGVLLAILTLTFYFVVRNLGVLKMICFQTPSKSVLAIIMYETCPFVTTGNFIYSHSTLYLASGSVYIKTCSDLWLFSCRRSLRFYV